MKKWKTITAMIVVLCMLVFSSGASALANKSSAATGANVIVYINGDADGDSVVTIVDATLIQRVLVKLHDDADGMVAIRGDVDKDGLDITDATYVQRYLALYDDHKKIGTEMNKIIGSSVELPEDPL